MIINIQSRPTSPRPTTINVLTREAERRRLGCHFWLSTSKNRFQLTRFNYTQSCRYIFNFKIRRARHTNFEITFNGRYWYLQSRANIFDLLKKKHGPQYQMFSTYTHPLTSTSQPEDRAGCKVSLGDHEGMRFSWSFCFLNFCVTAEALKLQNLAANFESLSLSLSVHGEQAAPTTSENVTMVSLGCFYSSRSGLA